MTDDERKEECGISKDDGRWGFGPITEPLGYARALRRIYGEPPVDVDKEVEALLGNQEEGEEETD